MKMFDYSAFGKSFKLYRREKHITIEQLTEKLKVTSGYIHNIETGNVKIGLRLLIKICNIFQVNIKSFFEKKQEQDFILEQRFRVIIDKYTKEDKRLLLNIMKNIEIMGGDGESGV